ncbi:MAG: amidohydrolase family protein [Chloroflexota bacterium]
MIDNHCHPLLRDQDILDLETWRGFFTEGGAALADHVPTTLFYRRAIRELSDLFGCDDNENAVFRARQRMAPDALARRCLHDLTVLVLDTGYPPRDEAMTAEEMASLTGARVAPLLRLEVLFEDSIAVSGNVGDLVSAVEAALADIRAAGWVGLKSIAAYRGGLVISRPESGEVEEAFQAARQNVEREGRLRLGYRPLHHFLLHVAFRAAAAQEVPVQFHTGYGDTDADLLLANPLHLRAILEDPAYRAMPVVLLHESYPYTREGGYLAAVYPQVYLDLSYAIPFLSYQAMEAFTREALGVAPLSKLLYASDAVNLPELYWLSVRDGRRILADALAETARDGEQSGRDADGALEDITGGNARRLYGLQAEL